MYIINIDIIMIIIQYYCASCGACFVYIHVNVAFAAVAGLRWTDGTEQRVKRVGRLYFCGRA